MSRHVSRIGHVSSVLAASLLVLALAGCEGGDKGTPAGDSVGAASAPPSAAALAALVKADAVDGATDKVVSKCLTCNLGMDGDAQHVAKLGDYQLHLCSGACKAAFEKAPEKALLAVKVPE